MPEQCHLTNWVLFFVFQGVFLLFFFFSNVCNVHVFVNKQILQRLPSLGRHCLKDNFEHCLHWITSIEDMLHLPYNKQPMSSLEEACRCAIHYELTT